MAAPGWGRCGDCGMLWTAVTGHNTSFTESRGMFPLCERCWEALTPEERLPHYRKAWETWPPGHAEWEVIERVVLEEEKHKLVFKPESGVSSSAGRISCFHDVPTSEVPGPELVVAP